MARRRKSRKQTCSVVCGRKTKSRKTYKKCLKVCKKVKCAKRCYGPKRKGRRQIAPKLAKAFGFLNL